MRLGLIANGSMGESCLKIVMSDARFRLSFLLYDRALDNRLLKTLAEGLGISAFPFDDPNSQETFAAIAARDCDYLININSRLLLGQQMVRFPKIGIVNFHNAPLPAYRGLNVCSWALLNGEITYGISWHQVDLGIDSGPTIYATDVPISSNETAATLIVKCINAGIATFPDLLDCLLGETRTWRRTEVITKPRLYRRADRPESLLVPLDDGFGPSVRFLRALDFRPFPNDFVTARIAVDGAEYEILSYRAIQNSGCRRSGEPISLTKLGSGIALDGGTLFLSKVKDPSGATIDLTKP